MKKVGIILIIVSIVGYYLYSTSDLSTENKAKKIIEKQIKNDETGYKLYGVSTKDYDDIDVEYIEKRGIPGHDSQLYYFDINFEVGDSFTNLNKEDKYQFLWDLRLIVDQSFTRKCIGENMCTGKVIVVDGVDEYKFETLEENKITMNGDDYYEQEIVNKPASDSSSTEKDSETRVNNKVGSDWNSLTENKKFHAVSNALYQIESSGYTITESEQYYINSLDEHYKGGSNSNEPVDEALADIGVISGTIFK